MQSSSVAAPDRLPTWIRVVSFAPAGIAFAFVTLAALSMTGWGFALGFAAMSGATAGALLLLALTGRVSSAVIAGGAALGCLPVAICLIAYATGLL